MIIHRKDRWNSLFLLWGTVALIPTFFTVTGENPNMLRTFTVLPANIFAMVVAIERIVSFTSKRYRLYAVIGITLLLLASQLYDLRTYFMFQSRVTRNSFEVTCPLQKSLTFNAKTLGEIPPRCRVTENLF